MTTVVQAIADRAVFELDLRRNPSRRDSSAARYRWWREYAAARSFRLSRAIAATAAIPDCWRNVGLPYQPTFHELREL